MNIKDHRKLAQWLIASKETEAPISGTERAAFIFGNMEPDMNLFTYFRGFFHHTRMRGHNYENGTGKSGQAVGKDRKTGRENRRRKHAAVFPDRCFDALYCGCVYLAA